MGGLLPPAERRSSALMGLYTALSLLLLMIGDRLPTATLRGVGGWVFAPFDRVVLVVDRLAAAWHENQRLHVRLTELEIENARLHDAGAENQELRRVLSLPPWPELSLKPVEILSLSGEPIPSAATLSAGSRDGVHEGDAVVTRDGLLGRVAESYPRLSRVMLLTDPNSAVACEVETTGVLGVLHFVTTPRPRLVLTGVPVSDTVLAGQRVLTSGMSQHYPRGLRVGRIQHVGRDPSGLTHDLEVALAARLSHLRHGFVIPRTRAGGVEP